MGKKYWSASFEASIASREYFSIEKATALYENNKLDITFFVSCFNEEKFIIDTLMAIITAMTKVDKSYEIIVIDDCSKDNSVKLIKNFVNSHPDIPIILRVNKKNKGLAQNYIDGAFLGRGKYYRLCCGDNSEPVETIVKILGYLDQADIIVPYYIEFRDRCLYRQFLSKTYTKVINLISGNQINYYNGLHVHLRHNILRWQSNTRGFGFQAALLCSLIAMGFSYKEVPCITIERRGGRGNAVTWKNLRSVTHTIVSIFLRKLFS